MDPVTPGQAIVHEIATEVCEPIDTPPVYGLGLSEEIVSEAVATAT
jgi:hypothetical protein